MRSSSFVKFWVLCGIGLMGACGGGGGGNGGGGGGSSAASQANLGIARAGLSTMEMDAFNRGRVVFEHDFTPGEGLGPLYNTTSCSHCHNSPVSGGGSPRYRNFYLTAIGPSTQQFAIPGLPSVVVPSFGSGFHITATFRLDGGRAVIPTDFFGAQISTAQRNALPMFGVGLFQTISDLAILANADPDDSDGDGISGRFNTVMGTVGRFGVKAQTNNIENFVRAPLQNQMGITTNPLLGNGATVSLHSGAAFGSFQVSADPNAPTTDNDGIPDPEMSAGDLSDLIAFSTLLAPPTRRASTPATDRGEATFSQIGCAKCHIPSLDGSQGPVFAYTDLLLHDLGNGDGISQGAPQVGATTIPDTTAEFKTAPLWGVSFTRPFMHDGLADTLYEAILLHAGEATAIRDAFVALPTADQADLIAFLEIL